jgi:hypothetical protein
LSSALATPPRRLAAPVVAFLLLLPFSFSRSWHEVVTTRVAAEQMEEARAPRVVPSYREAVIMER